MLSSHCARRPCEYVYVYDGTSVRTQIWIFFDDWGDFFFTEWGQILWAAGAFEKIKYIIHAGT